MGLKFERVWNADDQTPSRKPWNNANAQIRLPTDAQRRQFAPCRCDWWNRAAAGSIVGTDSAEAKLLQARLELATMSWEVLKDVKLAWLDVSASRIGDDCPRRNSLRARRAPW